MLRRACLAALFLALALPSGAAHAATASELVPGVTYKRQVRWTSAGPLVVHVITAPPPGGLYAFKPVLAYNRVSGRQTVSEMQRRFAGRATVAGINGDFFGSRTGAPSGIVLRSGELESTPQGRRSSLGIGLDGILRVGRISNASNWTVPGYEPRRLFRINKRLVRPGVALFTPAWGSVTTVHDSAVDVVLTDLPKVVPGQQLIAKIAAVRRGGGTAIPPGGGVLQARGKDWASLLARRARPGGGVVFDIGLRHWWTDVASAVGGGPLLVRDGVAVRSAGEHFTWSQLYGRHPRTAVGQLADGRLILVAVDGRTWFSTGLRISELAAQMVRLGAVTAMALDGGGSTTIAFDGNVLNHPSDGFERPVANSLMLFYYGIYTPRPRYRVFSPNGDGVTDVQSLSARLVRASDVDIALVQPDGVVAWRYAGPLAPGTLSKRVTSTLPEGRWRWIAYARDKQGRESIMDRVFVLNNTLGFLMVSKTRMAVHAKTGGRLLVSVRLAREARLSFSVLDSGGAVVRKLVSGSLGPGTYGVTWNGKNDAGRSVGPGTYTIQAQARNELGRVALNRRLLVLAES